MLTTVETYWITITLLQFMKFVEVRGYNIFAWWISFFPPQIITFFYCFSTEFKITSCKYLLMG